MCSLILWNQTKLFPNGRCVDGHSPPSFTTLFFEIEGASLCRCLLQTAQFEKQSFFFFLFFFHKRQQYKDRVILLCNIHESGGLARAQSLNIKPASTFKDNIVTSDVSNIIRPV